MPAYRKQHFLPAAYLGAFGFPKEKTPRKRSVYRIGRNTSGIVSINSQCQKPYFYSKIRPQEAEMYFSKVERIFELCLPPIEAGVELSHDRLFNLFLYAADLYARNLKFHTAWHGENLDYYKKRIEIFKSRLLHTEFEDLSDTERRDRIIAQWKFAIVSFSSDNCLLTSDCPSLYFGSSSFGNLLKAILLPISPNHLFVGADPDAYEIAQTVGSVSDSFQIN